MKKKNENINCGPGRSNEKIHLKLLISKKSKAPPEKKGKIPTFLKIISKWKKSDTAPFIFLTFFSHRHKKNPSDPSWAVDSTLDLAK